MDSTATANPLLTLTLNKFMQGNEAFVAGDLFPVFFTGEQAAEYYVFDADNMLSIPTDIRRAPAGDYTRSMSKLSEDTYNCREFGHEEPVDDSTRKKYSKAFDADRAASDRLGNILLINREIRAAAKAAAITNTSTPVVKWDAANATVIADIDAAKDVIHSKCGMEANLLVLPRSVFKIVKRLSAITDLMKVTGNKVVTPQLLAELFGVPKVRIAGGLYNSAHQGQALAAAQIWSDNVVLAHVNPAQDMQAVNFGRTFAWTGETGGGDNLAIVESYREEKVRSDIHRARQCVDEKITGMECAYLLSDVLTS